MSTNLNMESRTNKDGGTYRVEDRANDAGHSGGVFKKTAVLLVVYTSMVPLEPLVVQPFLQWIATNGPKKDIHEERRGTTAPKLGFRIHERK
jgi:hypothetical protein